MNQTAIKGAFATLSSALLIIIGLGVGVNGALAQSRESTCEPPAAGEYLLFVVTNNRQSRGLLKQSLPANTKATVCRYLDNIVTRVSGFTSLEEAQELVQNLKTSTGLSAFVVEPTTDAEEVATPPKPTSPPAPVSNTQEQQKPQPPTENLPAVNSQLLGRGYAVLVDYRNQPETITQLQQLLGKKISVVSFGQRPYLLALYTSNPRNASNTFRLLNDRGFLVMLVDANQVTLVKPQAETPQ